MNVGDGRRASTHNRVTERLVQQRVSLPENYVKTTRKVSGVVHTAERNYRQISANNYIPCLAFIKQRVCVWNSCAQPAPSSKMSLELTLLIPTRKKSDIRTGHLQSSRLLCFFSVSPAQIPDLTSVRSWPLPSIFLPIHYSPIFLLPTPADID